MIDRALSDLELLAGSLMRTRLRQGLRLALVRVDHAAVETLHGDERAAVARAIPARQAEFATGRMLLRSLLGADCVFPRSASGAPELQPGAIASVSHADGLVIVVAGRDGAAFVGVDLERNGAVDERTAPLIVRDDEVGLDPTLAHCAKEAAYKAWSSAGGRFLEHHDLRVRVEGDRFDAEIVDDGVTVRGAWGRTTGHTLAFAVLDRRPQAS